MCFGFRSNMHRKSWGFGTSRDYRVPERSSRSIGRCKGSDSRVRIPKLRQAKANLTLTPFCTQLTGITQSIVDGGVPFLESLASHMRWLTDSLGEAPTSDNILFVTCVDWNLKTMMIVSNMGGLLKFYKLDFIERPRFGIDDCKDRVRYLCQKYQIIRCFVKIHWNQSIFWKANYNHELCFFFCGCHVFGFFIRSSDVL